MFIYRNQQPLTFVLTTPFSNTISNPLNHKTFQIFFLSTPLTLLYTCSAIQPSFIFSIWLKCTSVTWVIYFYIKSTFIHQLSKESCTFLSCLTTNTSWVHCSYYIQLTFLFLLIYPTLTSCNKLYRNRFTAILFYKSSYLRADYIPPTTFLWSFTYFKTSLPISSFL